ncbi:MAG: hypothetical protein Q9Q13_03950 [Acidobacteriota bacterium]|nr:hypothetical protein [Acidobacteriota bacterium]
MHWRRKVLALLILVSPAPVTWANKVTRLTLGPVAPLSVKVASSQGVSYDKVVSTDELEFSVSADCRFDKKPGFQEHDLNELTINPSGLGGELRAPAWRSSHSWGRYWIKTPLLGEKVILRTRWNRTPGSRMADAVEACNDELARLVFKSPDKTREYFLARGFHVMVPDGGELKVSLTCNPLLPKAGFSDFHDKTKRFDLKIECLPSKAAKEKLVDGDTVEIKSFTTPPKKDAVACPGKVRFRATIASKAKVSGEAWLESMPAGPGSPPAGKGKKTKWSMSKPGQATSTLEQPWDGAAGKWTRGKTRLVLSWKDSSGKTWTTRSAPVTFDRRCSPASGGGLALAPQINSSTVEIKSFSVDKKKSALRCPGKVTFKARIGSREKLSGQAWLESMPKAGRPRQVGKKHNWTIRGAGQATSTIEQPWESPAGKWVEGRTRLVVGWKDLKGRTHTIRSKPVTFSRQCMKTAAIRIHR